MQLFFGQLVSENGELFADPFDGSSVTERQRRPVVRVHRQLSMSPELADHIVWTRLRSGPSSRGTSLVRLTLISAVPISIDKRDGGADILHRHQSPEGVICHDNDTRCSHARSHRSL